MRWGHVTAAVGASLPWHLPIKTALLPRLVCSGWLQSRNGSAAEQLGLQQLGVVALEPPLVVPVRVEHCITSQGAGRRMLPIQNPLRGECHGIVPHAHRKQDVTGRISEQSLVPGPQLYIACRRAFKAFTVSPRVESWFVTNR